jgi:MSHA pilin protein MshD
MSTRSRGVTLVELIVFMVIVGVALAGLFAAFSTMTRGSADPQVRKQVLAIAESLMDEVALMPLTYCDPDDANAVTATGPGVGGTECATNSEDTTMGPETMASVTETRYSTTARFDNVSDYHDFKMGTFYGQPAGIYDVTGTATIAGLNDYSASISVAKAGLSLGLPLDGDALRIAVTVHHGPSGVSRTLEGYRTRYAPNTTP